MILLDYDWMWVLAAGLTAAGRVLVRRIVV